MRSSRWVAVGAAAGLAVLLGWLGSTRLGSEAGDGSVAEAALPSVEAPPARPLPVLETPASAAEELSLRLLGTTTGRDSSRARAHIEDRTNEARFVVANGQPLPGHEDAVVTQIEDERVWIDRDGEVIELLLDPESRLSDSLESPTIDNFLAQHGGGDSENLLLGVAALHALRIGARDREALYAQGRFAPKRDASGAMEGLWVNAVTPGSFFDQLGLQRDDVILEVNGVVLDSPRAAALAWPALERETSLRVVLRGPEGPITLDSHTVRPD